MMLEVKPFSPTVLFMAVFLSLILTLSCDKEEGEDDRDGKSTGNLSICNADQADNCGVAVARNLTETNKKISSVETNFAPPVVGTLSINPGLYLDQAQALTDIKARVTDTLAGSSRALSFMHDFINLAQPQIMNIGGSLEGEIDMGNMTLLYKYETESKYELLSQGGETGNYYISVDGISYTLMRSDNSQEHPGINLIQMSYTDENNWTVLDVNTSDQCANRPMVIHSYVERKNGVWYGKAQNYKPYYEVCDPKPSASDNDFVFYTEFVGDIVMVSASMYRIPMSLSVNDTIDIYDYGDATPINPVCLENDKVAVAETPCESDNSDISESKYLDDTLWRLPVDLAELWNTFPTSL